jgi:hypothetical protein
MTNLSKKIIALIAGFVALSLPAVAQNPAVFAGAANAWAFAYGINPLAPPLLVDVPSPTAAGVATLSVAFGTVTLGDGTVITPLSTSAPIFVGIGANAETVTPTAVSCGTPTIYQSCTFTATFVNPHGTGDRVSSASYGLQEAAIFRSGKGGGLVLLSSDWFGRFATHAAGLTYLTTGAPKSVSTAVTVLDYSGITGVFSYAGAVAAAYASTAHVLY